DRQRLRKLFYTCWFMSHFESLPFLGMGLRLERDAWSMVKRRRQATNEYAPPPPLDGSVVPRDQSTHLSPFHALYFDLADWVSTPAPRQVSSNKLRQLLLVY
ncbi:unnamed protein product, partial [Sphacelaria rigidula]